MPRLAANLSMMFAEEPPLDRFGAAATCGFRAVEMHYPYGWPAGALRERLLRHGQEMVLINAPPGDLAAGERGLAALPGREREFARAMEEALAYSRALGCGRIHVMAGVVPPEAEAAPYVATYVDNLRWAAEQCAMQSVQLLIEPLNTRSAPGYLLTSLEQAEAVLETVGHPNLWIQFDLFHLQIMGGDLVRRFERVADRVAHVQIAGVPDRHEPDLGEVAYAYVLQRLEELGYKGWVGCEYTSARSTREGLTWAEPYDIRCPAHGRPALDEEPRTIIAVGEGPRPAAAPSPRSTSP